VQIIYEFPSDFRSRIYKKRFWLLARDRVWPLLLRGLRTFIGMFLVFSLVLCVLVILFIVLRSGGGGHRQNHDFSFIMYAFWVRNPFFRQYDDPRYHDYQVANENVPTRSLADEVFDFLFGPSRGDLEQDWWSLVEGVIARNNYVVGMDVMRPFSRGDVDDNFMAEICKGLGGVAVAGDDGQIRYEFVDLRDTGGDIQPVRLTYYKEPKWEFSRGSYYLAVILGAANVFVLTMLLPIMIAMGNGDMVRRKTLRGGDNVPFRQQQAPLLLLLLKFVYFIRYPLYLYGFLYFFVPMVRYLVCIKYLNSKIEARNKLRADMVSNVLGK